MASDDSSNPTHSPGTTVTPSSRRALSLYRMLPFDSAAYGDNCASFYDQLYPAIESGLLATLADLARGGPALDLGVGTGRVAIPLACSGVLVHGVEASRSMIDALRSKPGGGSIPVVHGDFISARLGSSYRLIFSLVSTFSLLPTLELQQASLFNIVRHLAPDGVFVCEGFVGAGAFPAPESAAVPIATPSGVVSYQVTSLSTPLSVFDAMALKAGLRLRERWRSWRKDPHGPADQRYISVYAREENHAT
jgi:SAM-dependent methyltransferase